MFGELISFLQLDFLDALSNLAPVVLSLIIALVMGLLIYYIYGKMFRGVVFNHKFSVTLAMMTVLSSMITLAISSNIALSLGMVGALSIVRYRTAIKDPMDIMYLFWAVGTGIAVGAKQHYLAVLGALAVIVALLILNQKKITNKIYIFLVHYTDENLDSDVEKILQNWRHQIKSKTIRQNDIELAIEIAVKNDNTSFMDEVRNLPSVRDITLIQYDGEYNQ